MLLLAPLLAVAGAASSCPAGADCYVGPASGAWLVGGSAWSRGVLPAFPGVAVVDKPIEVLAEADGAAVQVLVDRDVLTVRGPHGVLRIGPTKCGASEYATSSAAPGTAVTTCATKQCACQHGTGASGDTCPAHGASKCTACSGEYYLSNDACVAWTACTTAEHQTVAPSNTQDRQCATKQCTCANGDAATGAACATHNTATCATCAAGYGMVGATQSCEKCSAADRKYSLGNDNSACADHSACPAGQGSSFGSLNDATRQASQCTPCPAGTYSDSTGHGSCVAWTACGGSEYESTAPSASQNRACATKQCTCANGGAAASGSSCPAHGAANCVSCSGSFHLSNDACVAWTTCTAAQYETVAPSNTQNRACATKQCSCGNGDGASGTACPAHGSAKCASCSGSYYLSNGACVAWTACTTAEHQTVAPSNTQDRQCATKQCTCANGDAATGAACATHNTATCATCHTGYGMVPGAASCERCGAADRRYSLGNDNSACADHLTCGPGTGSSFGLLGDSERQASTCTACAPGTYSNSAGHGACVAWVACTGAEHEVAAPTAANNRVCATKQCACAHGSSASGASCPTHGAAKCVACAGSYYLSNNACVAWTTCAAGEYQVTAPSNTQNRVCASKQCTCANGTPQSGAACGAHGAHHCAECTGSYHLEGKRCVANTCTCDNGSPQSGAACDTHGDHRCQTCTGSYHLEGNICVANVCTCPHGTAATSAACTEHGAELCTGSACDAGYHPEVSSATSHQVCRLNQCHCDDGAPHTGAACLKHNDHHCYSCGETYHLDGKLCKENNCFCNNGQPVSSAHCATHNEHHCDSCDAYHFRRAADRTCQPLAECVHSCTSWTEPDATGHATQAACSAVCKSSGEWRCVGCSLATTSTDTVQKYYPVFVCATQFESKVPTPTSDRGCTPHTRCTTSQFEASAPSTTQDRVCHDHRTCLAGQWESREAGTHNDRECTDHTPPCEPSTTWEAQPPTSHHDRECRAHTPVCDTNTHWEERPPTGKQDRLCTPLTACDTSTEYETKPKSATSDRACAALTTCTDAQYESLPKSGVSDRQCATISAPCAQGTHYEHAPPTASADRHCRALTACDDVDSGTGSQYESKAPTSTSNRVCSTTSTCTGTQYETARPTANSDRTCSDHATCTETQFESGPATTTSDRTCSALRNCDYPATQYQSAPHTATSNRQCAALTTCNFPAVEYELKAPTTVSNRVCSAIATCGDDEYEVKAPTATANRLCADAGECANGTLASLHERAEANHCGSCDTGYYLHNRACVAWGGECQHGALRSQGTRTAGDQCGSCDAGYHLVGTSCLINSCICDNGEEKTGAECLLDKDHHCHSCTGAFHLEAKQCKPNLCVCNHGVPHSGEACPVHQAETCEFCSASFHIEEQLCKPNVCSCEHGSAQTGTACGVHQDHHCATCAVAYHLEDKQCTPNMCNCANGSAQSGTACGVHGDHHCESCDAGHKLHGKTCIAFAGTCSNGALISLASRTQDDHCGSCQAGHDLRGKACIAFAGSCSHGTLIELGSRTQDNHCGVCANGYYLKDKQCKPYGGSCSKGVLTDQPLRTKHDHCGSCHSGHELRGTTCVAFAGTCENGELITLASRTQDDHCGTCTGSFHLEGVRCVQNVCTCEHGAAQTGAACDVHNEHHCHVCSAGHFVTGKTCTRASCAHGTVDADAVTCACDAGYHGGGAWLSGSSYPACEQATCDNGQINDAAAFCTCNSGYFGGTHWVSGAIYPACIQWRQCNAGEGQSRAPSTTEDRQCSACVKGTSFSAAKHGLPCDSVYECAADEYETHAPTATSNRACASHSSECDYEHKYESARTTTTSDRACKPLTVCQDTQYVSVPETKTSDRSCDTCPAGFKCDGTAKIACAAPHYQPQTGQISCLACDFACPSGQQHEACGGKNAGTCVACAAGLAKSAPAVATCAACSPGHYAPALASGAKFGAAFCTPCEAGRHQSATGQSSCSPCTAGTYVNTTGSITASECSACPAGKYTATPGSSKCHSCAKGHYGHFFRTVDHAGHCVKCPHGKYQEADGVTKCDVCASGRYMSSTGGTACQTCPAIDGLRQWWTGGKAGASICTPKPLHCVAGNWGQWSACSATCGQGTRTRERDAAPQLPCSLTPASRCAEPWGGGRACAADELHEDETCDEGACPVDCVISQWGDWGSCSISCMSGSSGRGRQTRTRTLTQPRHGGVACPAVHVVETGECGKNCCPGSYSTGAESFQRLEETIDWVVSDDFQTGDNIVSKWHSLSNASTVRDVIENIKRGPEHYQVALADAAAICEHRDMHLCSHNEVTAAFSLGFDSCACAWASDGNMYQTLQAPRPNCGNSRGVLACDGTFEGKDKADVLCCGVPAAPTCRSCPKGKFQDDPNQGSCHECPSGTFNAVPEAIKCTKCDAGSFSSEPAATAQTACKGCPLGLWSPSGARVCTLCAAGQAIVTGKKQGVQSASHAACTTCAAGHFALRGSEMCRACPKGQYQAAREASGCVQCSAGRFAGSTGSTSTSACSICPAGKWATVGSSRCTACPGGTFSTHVGATSQSVCTQCGAGKASSAGQSACSTCGPGRYSEHNGAGAACVACDAGRFLAESGKASADDCTPCPAGGWSAQGATQCTACGKGKFAARGGTDVASCQHCAAGYFSAAAGAAQCEICPVGKFQVATGRTSCKACAPGTILLVEGATKASACQQCAAGRYQPSPAKTFCVPCGRGFYQPTAGSASCERCPKGKYGREDVSGTTGSRSESTACTDCLAGRYNPSRGAAGCIECEIGRHSTTVGAVTASTCEHCEWGQYNTATGSTACMACTKGRFGKATMQITLKGTYAHCLACPSGKYQQFDGSTQCDTCTPGTFTDPKSAKHSCEACPKVDALRYFWSDAGSSACFKHKLDCIPTKWSAWGTCSKSCGKGTQQRTRTPATQTPCALPGGIGCDQGWGVGARPCAEIDMAEEQACNERSCPVDCKLHDWGAWTACTKSCTPNASSSGPGETHRSRAIRVRAAHGGVACAHRHETRPCNVWSCRLPICHSDHIKCSVKQRSLTRGGGLGENECAKRPYLYAYTNCHTCDSPAECAIKGIHNVVTVEHGVRFYHLPFQRNSFHCFMTNQGKGCDCRCKEHPPCLAKKAMRVTGQPLLGNVYHSVQGRQACCNMCTNNPNCHAFEYDASAAVCSLHGTDSHGAKEPSFTVAQGQDNIWSGCSWGSNCPALAADVVASDAAVEFGLYDAQADGTADPALAGGWKLMSMGDFTKYRAAFEKVYNAVGINAIANFHSGNCCVAAKGGGMLVLTPSAYGFMFPASLDNTLACNPQHGYSATATGPAYRFYNMQAMTSRREIAVKPACTIDHNPGVYMRAKQ